MDEFIKRASPFYKDGDIIRRRDTRAVTEKFYGVTWDESADTYIRTGALTDVAVGSSPGNALLPIQAAMRRCLQEDTGAINYYLDPGDSTLKVGGAAATLTGADGQVMTQIPAFYYRYGYAGTSHTWDISYEPLDGFSVHPAFVKNGGFVPYRYIGAYEGSMYDASAAAMVGSADIVNAYTITSGDKLCSLSGEYPKTNETRDEFRIMSAMRGNGWRQYDYDLASAIQLLYLTEYADFNSQAMIGEGRTGLSGGSWIADSYIGQCGKSNVDGNGTNSVGGNTNNAYMSFRGIENLYGNVWKWVDGININANVPYVSNDDSDFQDDTLENYTALGITLINANGYQNTLEQQDRGFLPASVGASSSTKITDYYYQSTVWRVALLGGGAGLASAAGAFCASLSCDSAGDFVNVSARLCR